MTIEYATTVTLSGFGWDDVAWRYLAYRTNIDGEIVAYAYASTCDAALAELATVHA